MKAIQIHNYGNPNVLNYEEIPIVHPKAGEVLIHNRAIGVNFVDIYLRKGIFNTPLPFIPGKEGAGDIIAIGEGVKDFSVGDRVAYIETLGAYAEQTIVPVHFLIPLPDNISYEIAAASLLKGLTARFLIRQTFQVKAITHGQRCHVVYDSIGKMTFPGSLDCLRPFGCFVSFGFSSGLIPPFDILTLLEKGSLYATWPGLTTYLSKRSDVLSMSKEFFDIISNNIIKIQSPLQLSLEHATEAHQKLESRKLTKDTVMIP
ncbi:alcohol dehydrogenase catalytic domain-containing protein [Commensalibacter melissae]|uniref:Quinone oxidoreductase n=1 Tax=Commensalibacter melissae TaxID=2070537 RepID=A0A318N185_9PROT|nr:quinone oxidoreductase [Commensalibacter melissae]PXZ00300.1 quinone oxidoreductase [Commensalibacter melissae]QGT67800.1 alcohol dehydrogenase catalytic domain-containing protein [Commensalibacter melissae]